MTARSHTKRRRRDRLRRRALPSREERKRTDPRDEWHPEPAGYRAWLADARRRAGSDAG